MYKLKDVVVDIQSELDELVRYTTKRWDNIPEIGAVFALAAKAGLEEGRCWFESHPLWLGLDDRIHKRCALLGKGLPVDGNLARYYDQSCVWMDALISELRRLEPLGMKLNGPWDYSTSAFAVYKQLIAQYPEFSEARPKGWKALASNYTDFAGQEEYCEAHQIADEKEFLGADSQFGGSAGFPGRTALPYVMFDEKNYGRKAAYTLIGSVYSHFLAIAQYRNTQGMLAALAALPLRDTEPELIWDLSVSTTYPLLQVAVDLASVQLKASTNGSPSPQEGFEQSMASSLAFEQLSPEEKAARRAANEARMAEIMQEIMSPESDLESDRKAELQNQTALALLKERFKASQPT